MSYRRDSDTFAARRERRMHPIWQVLGWIWMALIVVIAGAAARIVSQANRQQLWIGLSEDMYNQIRLPVVNMLARTMDFNLLISWIPGYPFYVDELIFFLAFLFIGVGLFSVLYAFMYTRIIPIRSPLEAPEVEAQRGRPKRRY